MKISQFAIAVLAVLTLSFGFTSAQMGPWMMGESFVPADDHTKQEEAEGKALWEKLQAGEISCENLADSDFAALGEYAMGLMLGENHAAMNQMMIRMMGEEGEEAMHAAMGKRFSGCDPAAALSSSGTGFMPMMFGRGGLADAGNQRSSWNMWNAMNPMMGYGSWGFWGGLGSILMIVFWVLVFLALVGLVRWLFQSPAKKTEEESAIEILKRRYAKGEIDRKEFEERLKDLTRA